MPDNYGSVYDNLDQYLNTLGNGYTGLDNSAQNEQDAYYASLPDSDPLKINWLQNQQSQGLAQAYSGYANIPYPQQRDTMSWLGKYLPPVAGALAGYGVGAGLGAAFGAAAPAGGGAALATGTGGGAGAAGGAVGGAAGTTGGSAAGAGGGLIGDTITVYGGAGGGAALSGAGAAGAAAGAGAGAAATPTGAYNQGNTIQVNGTTPTDGLGLDAGYLNSSAGAGAAASQAAGNTMNTNFNGSGNNMAGFDWTSLIGPAINGLGSYLGGQQSSNAAGQAAALAIGASQPWNVNLPGIGSSQFNQATRTASIDPNSVYSGFMNNGANLSNAGYGALNNMVGNPYGSTGFGGISSQLGDAFNASKNSGYAPGANVYGSQTAYNGLMTQAGNNASSLLGQAQGFNTSDRAGSYLNALNQQAGFSEGQATQNNLESQFGKGILASTAGGYQTQALNNSLQQNQAARQMQAQQMANNDLTNLNQNAGSALGQYQNLQQTGYGQNYQNQVFGNSLSNQMFSNALGLFGAGMQSNQQQFGQAGSLYNQGQENNLNVSNYLSSLLGLGGNLGNLSSGAAGTSAGIIAGNGANQGAAMSNFFNSLGSSVDWSKLFGK